MSEILDPLAGAIEKKKKEIHLNVSWLEAFITSVVTEQADKVFLCMIDYRNTKVLRLILTNFAVKSI